MQNIALDARIRCRTTQLSSPETEQAQPKPAEQAETVQDFLIKYPPPPAFTEKYQIFGELGSGGFGFVVTAIDTNSREWAVKFIHKNRIPAESWCIDKILGRVPLEAHILSRMSHPAIISMVGYFENDGFCIIVTELHGAAWQTEIKQMVKTENELCGVDQLSNMEKDLQSPCSLSPCTPSPTSSQSSRSIPNVLSTSLTDMVIPELVRRSSMDLFECIEQNDHFTEAQAAYVFKQIVEGVHHMHSRNVVHRDIKDENIVIDDQYRVKIIDFGSAAVDIGSPYKSFRGTIQYAAPEILRGEKYYGRPCDTWALGVLLYIILYGEVPFTSGEAAASEPPRAPRFPTSTECMHLISWMLQKKAIRRPTIEQVFFHPWLQRAPSVQEVTSQLSS